MRQLLVIAVFLTVAACSVAFTGPVRTYILNTFNNFRSSLAKGNERWANFSIDYYYWQTGEPSPWNKKFPRSKKTFQLKWDNALAASAGARVDTLNANQEMSGTVPKTVGEIHHGVIYKISSNKFTARLMFNDAWHGSWYGWLEDWGLKSMKYAYDSENEYQNMAYQFMAGNVQKIGCSYRNMSDTFAMVCHLSPKGLAAGVSVYPTGPTCSGCPSNAPCNTGKGLCVVKASAG